VTRCIWHGCDAHEARRDGDGVTLHLARLRVWFCDPHWREYSMLSAIERLALRRAWGEVAP
jgi:hypothetical protein